MTDVPSHSHLLPTLLRHAGIDFLHLGCNPASASPGVPELFWWEGPDGSQLLTMYAHGYYGAGLEPPSDWPHRTWLAMLMTNDNVGPPPPQKVKEVFAEAKRLFSAGTNVRFGSLGDFARLLLAEAPDLPVIRGDMPDSWIHGIMTLPEGTKTARNVRPLLPAVEALDTLLGVWGDPTEPLAELLDEAYEQSLLYSEHTWGLYGTACGPFRYGEEWRKAYASGVYAPAEQSYDDHQEYIRTTRDLVLPALEQRLMQLAAAVDVAGPRAVVFNPLPWPRDAVVRCPGFPEDVKALRDLHRGAVVDVQRVGDEALFVAAAVPSLGYSTYVPAAARTTEPDTVVSGRLENALLRVTVDAARGGVVSIVSKRTGRELVDDRRLALGQYLYERFDKAHVDAFLDAYLKTRPGWAGHLLRLWEQSGQSGPCGITLPAGMKVPRAQLVNLRGEPMGEPMPVEEGRLSLDLQAWAPASVVFE